MFGGKGFGNRGARLGFGAGNPLALHQVDSAKDAIFKSGKIVHAQGQCCCIRGRLLNLRRLGLEMRLLGLGFGLKMSLLRLRLRLKMRVLLWLLLWLRLV